MCDDRIRYIKICDDSSRESIDSIINYDKSYLTSELESYKEIYKIIIINRKRFQETPKMNTIYI
jgi:hypothetical protein